MGASVYAGLLRPGASVERAAAAPDDVWVIATLALFCVGIPVGIFVKILGASWARTAAVAALPSVLAVVVDYVFMKSRADLISS